jgi:hypothetical protein
MGVLQESSHMCVPSVSPKGAPNVGFARGSTTSLLILGLPSGPLSGLPNGGPPNGSAKGAPSVGPEAW